MSHTRNFVIDKNLVSPSDYFEYITTCKKGRSEFYQPLSPDIDTVLDTDPDLNLIAFYLPQFHRLEVNDHAWGRGFTEWTNVTKASPLFRGHRHPHLPIDVGFYDLENVSVIQRQIELARFAGLKGFCFHYYSFSGNPVMDSPLKSFLSLKQRDFKFMLCWANESWTKRWDGGNQEIIIPQVHTPEGDRNFIHEILPYLKHENYLRIDQKLPLIVYTPALIETGLSETIAYWREVVRRELSAELMLMHSPNQIDRFKRQLSQTNRDNPFDAKVQFPPMECLNHPLVVPREFSFSKTFHGTVYDYNDAMATSLAQLEADPTVIPTLVPSWDNSARKSEQAVIFIHSNPAHYQRWLSNALSINRRSGRKLAFVNAWNEWAEAAHLEPCSWYGYAYLNATRSAVANVNQRKANEP